MYKKLTLFGIFVLLVPIVFIPEYDYFWSMGFKFGKVMPDVQYHGIQLFLCLLVAAAFMFFAGLVHPKLSLWFGEKTRKRSSTIYGIVAGIAVVGLVEVNLIAHGIVEHEDRMLVSFYEEIEIGDTVGEVLGLSSSNNKHLRYSFSLQESERDLVAFDRNKNFVNFSYPNKFRTSRMRMVLETSLHPGDEGARIVGKYLLLDNRVTRSAES